MRHVPASSMTRTSTITRTRSTTSISSKSSAGDLTYLEPRPIQITLEDHTENPGENSAGIWARSARVVNYVIVSGSRTRAGAYVAWNCYVETFEGAHFTVRKRYGGGGEIGVMA